MNRKNQSNTPRLKRMNREGRLKSAAENWLKAYNGKSYIRGYLKHFGVDTGTAIMELLLLGVKLKNDEIAKARTGEQAALRAKNARKEERLKRQEVEQLSDGMFPYIEGYTAWGIPYGTTYEELEPAPNRERLDGREPLNDDPL